MRSIARHLVFQSLQGLREDSLTIDEGTSARSFGRPSNGSLQVRVQVRDPRAYTRILFGGSLGAAEAYMEGLWSSEELCDVLRLFARRWPDIQGLDRGSARLGLALGRMFQFVRRNSRRGSRRNIHAHYDLGNDFFDLFLDPTWSYSCAIFDDDHSTLEAAQIEKLDRVCRKLELSPSDEIIEIGGGWGGFALHAAANYGCRVTTTTISPAQRELAEHRVQTAGLSDRIRVLGLDYRDLEGCYDKLVSIEMIEAVGHAYLDTYLETCDRLLVPGGRALIQAIVIPDGEYEANRRTTDFIKRYIFPGGQLPSMARIHQSLSRSTGLCVSHEEDFSDDYARTLRLWRTRFVSQIDRVRALGLGDDFIRMWELYLASCEAGFVERTTRLRQLTLCRSSE